MNISKEIVKFAINKKIELFIYDISQKYKINCKDLLDSVFYNWYIVKIHEIFFIEVSFEKWPYSRTCNNLNKIKYYLNGAKEIKLFCWLNCFNGNKKYQDINDLIILYVDETIYHDLIETFKYLVYSD